MSDDNKELAIEALGDESNSSCVCFADVVPDVEKWTLDPEKNPRLVDSLGYIPRDKLIARGIANGELLEQFRRSPEYMRQFNPDFDDYISPVPDVKSMDEMELQDYALQNAQKINSVSQKIQAQKAAAESASESNPVENKEEA